MSVRAILSSAKILDQLAARARTDGAALLTSYSLQDQISPTALILTLTNSKSHTNLYDAFEFQDSIDHFKVTKGLFDTATSTDFTTKRSTKGLFDTASSSEYVVAGAAKIKKDTVSLLDSLDSNRAKMPLDTIFSSELFKILVYPEALPPAYAVTEALIHALKPTKGFGDVTNILTNTDISVLLKRLDIVNIISQPRKLTELGFTFGSLLYDSGNAEVDYNTVVLEEGATGPFYTFPSGDVKAPVTSTVETIGVRAIGSRYGPNGDYQNYVYTLQVNVSAQNIAVVGKEYGSVLLSEDLTPYQSGSLLREITFKVVQNSGSFSVGTDNPERRTEQLASSNTLEELYFKKGAFDTTSIANYILANPSRFTKEILDVESAPRKKAALSFKWPLGSIEDTRDNRAGSFFTIENEHSTQRPTKGLFDTSSISVNTLHQGRSSFTRETLGVGSSARNKPMLEFKWPLGSIEDTRDNRAGSFFTIENEHSTQRPTKGLFDTSSIAVNILHQGRSSFTKEILTVESGPRNKPMLEFKWPSNHADRPGDFITLGLTDHGKEIVKRTQEYIDLRLAITAGRSSYTKEELSVENVPRNKPILQFKDLADLGRQGVFLNFSSFEHGKKIHKPTKDSLVSSEYNVVARPLLAYDFLDSSIDVRLKPVKPIFDSINIPELIKKLVSKGSNFELLNTNTEVLEAGKSHFSLQKATIASLVKKYVEKGRFDESIQYEDEFLKKVIKGFYEDTSISSNIEALGRSDFTKEVLDVESGPRKYNNIELRFDDRPLIIKDRYQIRSGYVSRTQQYVIDYVYTYNEDGSVETVQAVYGQRAIFWGGVYLNNVTGISTSNITKTVLKVLSKHDGSILFTGSIKSINANTGLVITDSAFVTSNDGYDDHVIFDPGNTIELHTNWTRKPIYRKNFRPTYTTVQLPVYDRRGEIVENKYTTYRYLSSYYYQTSFAGYIRDYQYDRQETRLSIQAGRRDKENWGGFGIKFGMPFKKYEYINSTSTTYSAKNRIANSAAQLVSPDFLQWLFLLGKFDGAEASELVVKYLIKGPVYDNATIRQTFFDIVRLEILLDRFQTSETSTRNIRPKFNDAANVLELIKKYFTKPRQDSVSTSSSTLSNRADLALESVNTQDNYVADIYKPRNEAISLIATFERPTDYKRSEDEYLELQDTREFFGHTYATADYFGEQYVGRIINRV